MRAVLGDGRHAHAVARADGELVAFVELETHWPRRPWVAFAGVAKERRDRGLGSALVAWLLARQFAAGAKAALLALSPANRTALRAYEKVGFRRFRLIDALEKKLCRRAASAARPTSERERSPRRYAGSSSSTAISRLQWIRTAGPPTPRPRFT